MPGVLHGARERWRQGSGAGPRRSAACMQRWPRRRSTGHGQTAAEHVAVASVPALPALMRSPGGLLARMRARTSVMHAPERNGLNGAAPIRQRGCTHVRKWTCSA